MLLSLEAQELSMITHTIGWYRIDTDTQVYYYYIDVQFK